MNKENIYIEIAQLVISIGIGFFMGNLYSLISLIETFPVDTSNVIHVEKILPESSIRMIKRIAQEKRFNEDTAIRIATCESQLGKYKYNFEGSGATGIMQFMPPTFKSFCRGDINNNEDQIRCFMDLYPKYAGLWECK